MLSLAPTLLSGSRSTAKNLLSYTQSAGESGALYYTTADSLPALRKGVPWPLTNFSNGPLKNGGGTYGELFIIATFAAEVWLNEVQVAVGQFNGAYNTPRRLSIYRGQTTSNPLINPTAQNLNIGTGTPSAPPLTVFDLSANQDFETPSNTYLFRFWSASNQNVAIQGLAIYGDVT